MKAQYLRARASARAAARAEDAAGGQRDDVEPPGVRVGRVAVVARGRAHGREALRGRHVAEEHVARVAELRLREEEVVVVVFVERVAVVEVVRDPGLGAPAVARGAAAVGDEREDARGEVRHEQHAHDEVHEVAAVGEELVARVVVPLARAVHELGELEELEHAAHLEDLQKPRERARAARGPVLVVLDEQEDVREGHARQQVDGREALEVGLGLPSASGTMARRVPGRKLSKLAAGRRSSR